VSHLTEKNRFHRFSDEQAKSRRSSDEKAANASNQEDISKAKY
jgi:hypothetical protein